MLEVRMSVSLRLRGWVLVGLAAAALAAVGPVRGGEFTLALDEGQGTKTTAEGEPNLKGSVVNAQWVDGKQGKALAFNDYGNELVKPDSSKATYVTFKHDDALVPKSKVTLSAQVMLDRENPFYYGGIVEKGDGFGAAYRLGVLRNRKIRASVGNKLLSVESPEPLSVGEWHELSMSYDGQKLVLSIDGKEVAQKEGTVEKFDNKSPLVLGTRLTGKIDEVKISAD
jgi:hypothetical protein